MPLVARSLEHLDVSHSVATRYSANYVKGPAGVALALTPTCLRHLGTPTWRTLARSQFAVQQCVNVVLAGGVHYRGAGPIEPTTAAWLRT